MRGLIRAPFWFIGLLLLAAIFVGLYAYFTTPLPYGLGAYFQTPGGGNVPAAAPGATLTPGAAGARAAAGTPLRLGAASVAVQTVQRNQDLAAHGGPPGSFTVLDLSLQNAGAQPVTADPSAFRLVDDRGREYLIDMEASRAMNASARRRNLFDASVPPGGQLATYLAFEVPADTNAVTLRVQLGYGEAELPRQ